MSGKERGEERNWVEERLVTETGNWGEFLVFRLKPANPAKWGFVLAFRFGTRSLLVSLLGTEPRSRCFYSIRLQNGSEFEFLLMVPWSEPNSWTLPLPSSCYRRRNCLISVFGEQSFVLFVIKYDEVRIPLRVPLSNFLNAFIFGFLFVLNFLFAAYLVEFFP